MDQTGGVQASGVQTSGVQAQKDRTDKDRSVLAKLVVWFFFWPFKILFALIVYLLPLIWALLKFIFNIVTLGIIPRELGPESYGDFGYLTHFFNKTMKFLKFGVPTLVNTTPKQWIPDKLKNLVTSA